MLTRIDLCSMALLKIGEQSIQSFNDNSAGAGLARTLFDPVMDSLIAQHPWRFAQKKYSLPKTIDGDFIIPVDVLRIINCDAEIIGNRIKSAKEIMDITAVARVPVEEYPAYFTALAATKLAMEFCIPLLGDQNIFRMLAALYDTELRTARFIDSTMAADNNITDFSLLSARF